jgi:hypothetical protein
MVDKKQKLKRNLDLEIVELKIQMHTNIDTEVELTADKIANKSISGKYPFLCTNCRYSKDILNNKTQNDIFDIFFNRQKFNNFVLASKLKKNQTISGRYYSSIVKENIIIMLNSLFPISFPVSDTVTLLDNNATNLFEIGKNILFKTNKYTYLNLNKPSTVTQVIWLNTISSNPIYYEINKKVKKYYKDVLDSVENISSNEIKKILNSDVEDIIKISRIQDIIKKIYVTSKNKEEWILYFLVSNLKKNTREYNEFIQTYISEFINSKQEIRYSYRNNNSSEQNERQFFESVPEIKFYQKYMSEMVELLPPKRTTMKKKEGDNKKNKEIDIADALKTAKDNNDFSEFTKLYSDNKDAYCELIRLEDGKYEIHLGVAVVGGKVTNTNYRFLCNYNSHRLGNDLNYLIKDTEENSDKIRLYSYVDLENVKDTTEYVGVVNSSIKREKEVKRTGGSKTRNYRKNNQKTRKLLQRNFEKKQTSNN